MEITCKTILETLAKSFQADAAGDWETVIQFNFSGEGGGDYYLEIGGGKCTFHEGVSEGAKATVKCSAQVWLDLSLGKLNPMAAFMGGKLKVGGNMGDVMKLNNRKIFPVEPPKG